MDPGEIKSQVQSLTYAEKQAVIEILDTFRTFPENTTESYSSIIANILERLGKTEDANPAKHTPADACHPNVCDPNVCDPGPSTMTQRILSNAPRKQSTT